jgi:hypothetical protein
MPGRNKQLTQLGRDSYSWLGQLWLSLGWAGAYSPGVDQRPLPPAWADAPHVPARPSGRPPQLG